VLRGFPSIQLLRRARAPLRRVLSYPNCLFFGILVQTASTCLTTASLPHDFEFAKWKKLPANHLGRAFLITRAKLLGQHAFTDAGNFAPQLPEAADLIPQPE
jgi:hypothetical protein